MEKRLLALVALGVVGYLGYRWFVKNQGQAIANTTNRLGTTTELMYADLMRRASGWQTSNPATESSLDATLIERQISPAIPFTEREIYYA